jgi:striatin 1/3/4
MAVEATARPPSSPAVKTVGLPDSVPNGLGFTTRMGSARGGYVEASLKPFEKSNTAAQRDSSSDAESESQLLTAIYRPESKAAWREELRAANEKAERVR